MDFLYLNKEKKDENIYKGNNILHLSKKNFIIEKNNKLFIKTNQNTNGFIIIYSPFCEVCKNHAEQWEEYATLLKNRFFISVLNAYGPDGDLSSYLSVKGYPTIKLIKLNGSLEDLPPMSMEDYFNIMLLYSENPV